MQNKETINMKEVKAYLTHSQYKSPNTTKALESLEHWFGVRDQINKTTAELRDMKPPPEDQIKINEQTIKEIDGKIDAIWNGLKQSIKNEIEEKENARKEASKQGVSQSKLVTDLQNAIKELEALLKKMRELEDPATRQAALASFLLKQPQEERHPLQGHPLQEPPQPRQAAPTWAVQPQRKLLAGLTGFDAENLESTLNKLKADKVIDNFNLTDRGFNVTVPTQAKNAPPPLITFDLQSKKIFSNNTSQEAYDAAARVTLAIGGKGFDMKELEAIKTPDGEACLFKAYVAGKKLEDQGFKFKGLSAEKADELEQRYQNLQSEGYQEPPHPQ